MPNMTGVPYAQFAVGSRRYMADASGVIANVEPDDVLALIGCGAVVSTPWTPPTPASDETD